ncbi:MAG: hypothetical protein R3B96_12415 [Pirellulaceae bacterium]
MLARVPLTSLPWIVLVVVGAGTLALIALVFVVVRGGALAPAVRESVTLAMFAAGFVAFSASGLIPRQKYRDHFQRMLSLTPLIVWTYTDAEWLRWQRSAMTMAYGRTSNTRPAKVCVLVLLFGLIPGVMLWLSRPVVPFLVYWGGGIFSCRYPCCCTSFTGGTCAGPGSNGRAKPGFSRPASSFITSTSTGPRPPTKAWL